ncbi:Uncharacterised protein [uncultured archaeon]|nr:Uncharacterised protein [uncultured archaeon]
MYDVKDIIAYFEKYSLYLDGEYSKYMDKSIYKSNKRMTQLSIVISLVMIFLTVFSFFISFINTSASSVNSVDSMCGSYYLDYFNSSNFTEHCFNLSSMKASFGSTVVNVSTDIFNTLKWLFLIITIIIVGLLVFDVWVDQGYQDRLENINNGIVLMRTIIAGLHSLKINYSDKLKSKEVQSLLSSFDKIPIQLGAQKSLELFSTNLLHILNRYLHETKK